MNTSEEIKQAIKRLTGDQRELIYDWLGFYVDSRPLEFAIKEPQTAYETHNPFMTLDEYMEFESQSPLRHEYVNGIVYAMAGPSIAHARIATKLLVALESHLRASPCEAFAADVKLKIQSESEEIVYYPDLIVACNREEWESHAILNPKLVAEIASPSTRNIDRREKAMTYRRVASIEEYVLLEQDEHLVTVYERGSKWRPQVYRGPQAVAELRSISLSLPLNQIYEGTLPTG